MAVEQARLILCSILFGLVAVATVCIGYSDSMDILVPVRWSRWRVQVLRACYITLILIVTLFLTYSGLVLEQCVQENQSFPTLDDFWGWLFLVLFIRLMSMILPNPGWSFTLYSLLASSITYLHLQISYALKSQLRYETLGVTDDPILDMENYYRGTARAVSFDNNLMTVHWAVGLDDASPNCFADIPINCPDFDMLVVRTNGTCVDLQRAIVEAPDWPFAESADLSEVPYTLVFGYWPTCQARYISPNVLGRNWSAYAYTSAFQPRLTFYLILSLLLSMLLLALWCRHRKQFTVVGITNERAPDRPRRRNRPQPEQAENPEAPPEQADLDVENEEEQQEEIEMEEVEDQIHRDAEQP